MVPTFFLTPLMPTMNLLFLTFSIPYGITCSIIYCAVFTTILEYFDRRRGTAFGVVIGCNALGTTMYSFFLPVLMNRVGWKETSWILTGMSFICVIFALVYRKPESRRQCSVNGEDVEVKLNGKKMEVNLKECTLEDEDDHLRTYCQLLKNKRFLMSLISFVSFTSVALMPSVFMVSFFIPFHFSSLGCLPVFIFFHFLCFLPSFLAFFFFFSFFLFFFLFFFLSSFLPSFRSSFLSFFLSFFSSFLAIFLPPFLPPNLHPSVHSLLYSPMHLSC